MRLILALVDAALLARLGLFLSNPLDLDIGLQLLLLLLLSLVLLAELASLLLNVSFHLQAGFFTRLLLLLLAAVLAQKPLRLLIIEFLVRRLCQKGPFSLLRLVLGRLVLAQVYNILVFFDDGARVAGARVLIQGRRLLFFRGLQLLVGVLLLLLARYLLLLLLLQKELMLLLLLIQGQLSLLKLLLLVFDELSDHDLLPVIARVVEVLPRVGVSRELILFFRIVVGGLIVQLVVLRLIEEVFIVGEVEHGVVVVVVELLLQLVLRTEELVVDLHRVGLLVIKLIGYVHLFARRLRDVQIDLLADQILLVQNRVGKLLLQNSFCQEPLDPVLDHGPLEHLVDVWPLIRVDLKQLVHQLLQVDRVVAGNRRVLPPDNFHCQLVQADPVKGRVQRDDLVEDYAQGPDIRLEVIGLIVDDLRRQIVGCSDHRLHVFAGVVEHARDTLKYSGEIRRKCV